MGKHAKPNEEPKRSLLNYLLQQNEPVKDRNPSSTSDDLDLMIDKRAEEKALLAARVQQEESLPAPEQPKTQNTHQPMIVESSAPRSKARGNKHRLRFTLIPILALLTLCMWFLRVKYHEGWTLMLITFAFWTVFFTITLIWSKTQDLLMNMGFSPPGMRWPLLFTLLTGVILAITESGRSLVMFVIAWLKYYVYLAGPVIDVYLVIVWYTLLAITIVMCGIIIVKIYQLLKITKEGYRP